jgi:hypothetical protein
LTKPTIAEAKEAGAPAGRKSASISVSTWTIGFTGERSCSCRAGSRSQTEPPGCAATRSSLRGTSAVFGAPLAQQPVSR